MAGLCVFQGPLLLLSSVKEIPEHALQASGWTGLKARLARESGLNLSFARLETLSIAAQFDLVSRARLLIGNHGAGLTWAAMLPSRRRIASRAAPCSSSTPMRAPTACPSTSRTLRRPTANGVRYRALAQQTSPDCQGKLIREGGHIVVDVPSLVGAVSEMRGPAPRRPRTGLRDIPEGTLRPPASDMVSTHATHWRRPANSSGPCSKVFTPASDFAGRVATRGQAT